MSDPKPLTVNQLTKYIRQKFRADPYIFKQDFWLQGELTNFRERKVNQYFSLKDDNTDLSAREQYQINAVMFAREFRRVKFTPENGMKVLVKGHVDVYPQQGSYQFYVQEMEVTGTGSLEVAFRQMYEKLKKEGLFDRPKKPIPPFPSRVAIVTSNDAAVKHDMITTFRRRNPLIQLVFYPTKVQGDDAAPQIARQIRRANEDGSYDLLIVARGGGSRGDLWAFNDEEVGRAIAASQLPVISSIGHEVDTTIADLAADDREATPTSAAVKGSQWLLTDVLAGLHQARDQLYNEMSRKLQMAQKELNQLRENYVFKQPDRMLVQYQQELDDVNNRLMSAIKEGLTQESIRIQSLQAKLNQNAPKVQLVRVKERFRHLKQQLLNIEEQDIKQKQNYVKNIREQLSLLNPTNILSRGYSYVTKGDQLVQSAGQLQAKDQVLIHFADGSTSAEITAKNEKDENNGRK